MMNRDDFFPVKELCRQHQIEVSFIHELRDNGLVSTLKVEETECIDADTLGAVERFIRMHYDLAINIEGLEAISHLLHKVEALQHQVSDLHNRLRLYEQEG